VSARDDWMVLEALEKIGAALGSGDARAVAALWDVPGLVLANQGGRAIESREQVAAFFEHAIRSYREQGTSGAVPESQGITWITDRIAAVSVDWIGTDAHGAARTRESSFYLMRVGDDDVARVQVAMPRTGP
jgi:hypothetical protein